MKNKKDNKLATTNNISIGNPVTEVPSQQSSKHKTKYSQVYEKIKELPAKQWLPITFDSIKRAQSFSGTARHNGLQIKTRKNVVYARPQENKL